MTAYCWCVTSEMQEAANATQWAALNPAIVITNSSVRQRDALSQMQAGDTVCIVGHGSAEAIGTAGASVTLTPADIAARLVTTMRMPDAVTVYLACCDTDVFAVALQQEIAALGNHDHVNCIGQVGGFLFDGTLRL